MNKFKVNYEEVSSIIQGDINFDYCGSSMESAQDAVNWLNKQEITADMVKKEFDQHMEAFNDYVCENASHGAYINRLGAKFIVDWVCFALLRENNMYYDEIKNPNGFWLETVTFVLNN